MKKNGMSYEQPPKLCTKCGRIRLRRGWRKVPKDWERLKLIEFYKGAEPDVCPNHRRWRMRKRRRRRKKSHKRRSGGSSRNNVQETPGRLMFYKLGPKLI